MLIQKVDVAGASELLKFQTSESLNYQSLKQEDYRK